MVRLTPMLVVRKHMKAGLKSSPPPRKGIDRSKLALRIFVLIGWTVTVTGVAIFTYSESYPVGTGQQPARVGILTLSQFGFWLIFSGIVLVVLSVGVAQALSCCHNRRETGLPLAVSAGTGADEGDEESSMLIGAKVNYGSTVNASPFSSASRSSIVRQA